MSFVQRELDKISAALRDPNAAEVHDKLYAAQQALSWAVDPELFKAPSGLWPGKASCVPNTAAD